MPISLDELRRAQPRFRKSSRTLTEAKRLRQRTAFLCHSHRDRELVEGFVTLLSEAGCDAYVDWADTEMPQSPNRVTAQRIKDKIAETDSFLFLATPNSVASRWCPWEIGYADARRGIDRVFVVPTEGNGTVYGNEYLDLYRRIDRAFSTPLGVFEIGQGTFVGPVANL